MLQNLMCHFFYKTIGPKMADIITYLITNLKKVFFIVTFEFLYRSYFSNFIFDEVKAKKILYKNWNKTSESFGIYCDFFSQYDLNCSSLFRFDYSHLALICKKFVLYKMIAHITEKILRIQIVNINIRITKKLK